MPNLGSQFNCPECGQPQFDERGYTPHVHGFTVHLEPEDIEAYQSWAQMGKLHAEAAEVERTRKVDLSNPDDLQDHLASDAAHMVDYPQYASSWRHELNGRKVPGVREFKGDDFKLTHDEMRKLHAAHHEIYGDEMPHLTHGDEHYHV